MPWSLSKSEVAGETVQGKPVAKFASRVLVGEHALFPNRILPRPGLGPVHPDKILGLFRVARVFPHAWRLERRFQNCTRLPIDRDGKLLHGDGFLLYSSYADVALSWNMDKDPGTRKELLQGLAVPASLSARHEAVAPGILPRSVLPYAE